MAEDKNKRDHDAEGSSGRDSANEPGPSGASPPCASVATGAGVPIELIGGRAGFMPDCGWGVRRERGRVTCTQYILAGRFRLWSILAGRFPLRSIVSDGFHLCHC